MKIVKYSSFSEAETEAKRLTSVLNLPKNMIYTLPFQIADGTWCLKVKEIGSYPVTGLISGAIENYEKPDLGPEPRIPS